MTRWRFATLLMAGATATACFAPTDGDGAAHVGETSERIIGGASDPTDVAVVALTQASTGTLCSGTLIAPNVVLTAAHCVYEVDPSDLQVLVGSDVTSPSQTLAVTSVAAYPTYSDEDTGLAGGIDLGAVYLAAPVSGLTPVALAAASTTDALADADLTLVGYGLDTTTSNTSAGVRRSVTLQVQQACSRLLTLGGTDANACFGDSGGAVLLGGALVAVISSGTEDCEAPSLMTRLDAHANWIAAVLAGAATASCPTCVPPDPACGAATETQAATTPVDAGQEDAATIRASASGTGCQLARQAAGRGPAFASCAMLMTLALALSRLRRRRRGRRRPRCLRASGSVSVPR